MKSLGAKTNHLPNIQGLTGDLALQEGAGTKYFGWKPVPRGRPRIEDKLIPSGRPESGFPWVNSEGYPRARIGIGVAISGAIPRGDRKIGAYSAATTSEGFAFADDIMKSEMRGTISDLKREPLKTP